VLARLRSRFATGPVGHLYAGLADAATLLVRHWSARLRRTLDRRSR
jgi:hypothetical protein